MRRAWKDRLARNCDQISEWLLYRFEVETKLNPRTHEQEFLDWVGLKNTPTARKRIHNPLPEPMED
jgi:hypothetical protein